MATYAIYIKDLPGGGVEVHRQLESGIHGTPSVAAKLAVFATDAVKDLVEREGDSIQTLSHTRIAAALARVKGGAA
ncbi:hypothetical protein [uncultured Stenotrophomonas sp.]|uniref:hypothetical protein n=1 Tax=uncultured Stenotrophomonas sp. TaxID=165438 RepID=UPI0025E5A585|nr:hypothetical protein [uncultured Stenotrophomonas sp.]